MSDNEEEEEEETREERRKRSKPKEEPKMKIKVGIRQIEKNKDKLSNQKKWSNKQIRKTEKLRICNQNYHWNIY